MKPVVWTIAGADSSGAAGAAADLKVFAALDAHGASVLTAVTAQGLQTFNASVPVGAPMIRAQIKALADLPPPAAIKIGMLPTAEAAEEVAAFVRDHPGFVVLDPVVSSSSGGCLTDDSALDAVQRELLPRVDLLTPNSLEAERLLGVPIRDAADVEKAAKRAVERGVRNVLIKGGHVGGLTSSDYFLSRAGKGFWIHSRKTEGAYVRGTGCALSAAVAVGIAKGLPLEDAIVLAKGYVTRGIREAYGPEEGPHFFGHGAWPVSQADMPWISRSPSQARRIFPDVGSEPLGFYPVVPNADWVDRLTAVGVRTIQLRIKGAGDLDAEIRRAARIAAERGARLFINDHWELAIAAGAYGVHLGQEDLETADLARIEAAGLRLGVSTHSLEEAAVANAFVASYVALGPIFATTCKSMRFGPQGMPRIAEWVSYFGVPVVAIGGLKLEHVAEAINLGADGVAVISDVLAHPDPERRARAWIKATGGGGS